MTSSSFQRILVRLPNWVGDIMMALPAIQSLRAKFPEARLIGMARPEHVELAQRIRMLDEIVPAPPRTGPDRHRAMLAAPRTLREANLDVAVLLATSFEAALTVWLAGIPVRLGHPTDHRAALLNRVVDSLDSHRSDRFHDLVAALGAEPMNPVDPVDSVQGLECAPADRAYADRLFATAGFNPDARPVFVNPASAKKPRAWSADRFRQVADYVAGSHGGPPVFVHDHHPFDRPDGWPSTDAIQMVAGASLVELAGVMERCALYVGNDSGPMHIAAALGLPTIGIYGPSSPEHTSPRGANGAAHVPVSAAFECAPCRERFFEECPSPASADERPPCLNNVSVERVTKAIDEMLNARPTTRERRPSPT